ncbi:hypothetical protein DNFV4_01421 [Nitrospira tepida]|uniref:Uncharacterized protein n=1 Tax=Nitrospira tepida TaxID=2973512 RepID=A0AA86MXQ2_9BACT|nr:hypothetical protein [Nitrospira tepida]CAI4030989.1 hypothetical protein DNFV4_01421 [Nitrospira tepida]
MMPSMMERDASRNSDKVTGRTSQPPRALTYDESKAAEAAFRGDPFNPSWSASAQKIYDGILAAMGKRELEQVHESEFQAECIGG